MVVGDESWGWAVAEKQFHYIFSIVLNDPMELVGVIGGVISYAVCDLVVSIAQTCAYCAKEKGCRANGNLHDSNIMFRNTSMCVWSY